MKRLLLIFIPVLMGCSLGQPVPPTAFPTATTVQSFPPTTVPTVARSVNTPLPTAVVQAAPVSSPTAVVSTCDADSDTRPQHRVVANVDYNARTVRVQQEVVYTNRTGEALDRLVFNVEPNRWLDVFALQRLTLGKGRSQGVYTLTGRRLDVMLPSPLEPGCAFQVDLLFTLDVPPIIGGVEAFRGYFGFSARQMNLGHWLPTVVPYIDGDWVFHESVFVGEQIVLEPADWYVAFNVTNAPGEVTIAAPGYAEQITATSWRFEHLNGREFSASLSNVFRVSSLMTPAGYAIDVYTMPDAVVPDGAGGWIDGGAFTAKITGESVDLYETLYGSYPHERMVVVQGDFPDGMEFSGFAFVSTDWFTNYDGSPEGYLMLITVHEVAHQWWYDLVGNDQALAPWLDEALATYSELVYIEAYYPELVDWWWWFRVNRLNPQGIVTSTVYQFDAIRPYINAVYLRGVLMLHDLRTVLGDDAFFEWMTAYANANSGQIATADDFWSLLTPEQTEAVALVRTAFTR